MAAPSLLDAAALPVVLVPLAIALLQAAYWALASRETRVSPEEASSAAEIARIKAAIAKLSPVSDFVEVSKLQRAKNKLERAAEDAHKARAAPGAAATRPSALLTRYVQPAVLALLVLAFWSQPIAALPPRWFAPLSWVMRSPGSPAGTVGVVTWVGLCHAVVAPAVRWAAAAAGVAAAQPAPPKSLMERATGLLGSLSGLSGGGRGGRAKAD